VRAMEFGKVRDKGWDDDGMMMGMVEVNQNGTSWGSLFRLARRT
jgi:hypothetical protein